MILGSNYSLFGKFIAFALFLLPFVFSRNLFYAGINAKVFFVLTTIYICGLFVVATLIKKSYGSERYKIFSLQKRPLTTAVIFFLGSFIVSAIFGVYTTGSLFSDIIRGTGVLFILHVAFLVYCLAYLTQDRDWSLIRRAVVLSSAILSALLIIGAEGFGFSGRIGVINLDIGGLTFANTTFAGIYLVLTFIIGCWELLQVKTNNIIRGFLVPCLGIIGLSPIFLNGGILNGSVSILSVLENPLLIVGSARASSITLLVFLLWLLGFWLIKFFTKTARYKITLAVSFVSMAAVVLSTSFLFVDGSSIQRWYIESSSAARVIVWQTGLEAFMDRPFFGWGPENFRFGFEQHFNNSLFLDKNQGEIWFDKAHNFQIDALVSVGIVGMLGYVGLFLAFGCILFRANKRGLISDSEALLLSMVPVWHFLQLQTGFDTVSSYTLGVVFLGYALQLESKMHDGDYFSISRKYRIIGAIALIVLISYSFYIFVFKEYTRQAALVNIFRTENQENQIYLINKALTGSRDFETHRLIFSSFLKGVFDQMSGLEESQQQILMKQVYEQLEVYDGYFQEYLKRKPDDYRARINYSYLLINKAAFRGNNGEDLAQAKLILEDSYKLSPLNPTTYVLTAIASLYSGDTKNAQEVVKKAVAMNPEIRFTTIMESYINKQAKSFPTISIIKLENL